MAGLSRAAVALTAIVAGSNMLSPFADSARYLTWRLSGRVVFSHYP